MNLSKIEEEFKDLYKTLFEQNKQHSDNFKFIYKLVDDEIKKLNDTIENYDLISDHTGEGYINLKNDIKELEYLIKLFTIKNLDILTKEQILNSLKELNISCKDVAFKIFNLSLTTYNIFASILMFLISTKIYKLSNDTKK